MYRSCMSTFQINNRITVLLAKLPGLPLPILPLPTLPTPPKNGCQIYCCRIFRLSSFPLPTLPLPSLPQISWPVDRVSCSCCMSGLDNTRPLIHEHCKKLLINVLLVFATHADHFTVAKLAISSRTLNEPSCLNLAPSSTSRAQTGASLPSVCLSVCLSVS